MPTITVGEVKVQNTHSYTTLQQTVAMPDLVSIQPSGLVGLALSIPLHISTTEMSLCLWVTLLPQWPS